MNALGVNIALEVAVQAPQRVRGLIIDLPVLEDSQTFWAMIIGPRLARCTPHRSLSCTPSRAGSPRRRPGSLLGTAKPAGSAELHGLRPANPA